ncbi:hypothetical protein ECG_07199 [Echinococcus granulosus]|uniref:Uncharacterized protein n=1 Tax=Echinococcus granulosus TaxID=6210 RepID=U6JHC5_ECHGR|nr:hypothetical protein EGR_10789 [Echinococcus granulosus]EUB54351.1 hypothetical protein EGR_10789 [Echinococcus granulosus]KAH9280012.1 hypothetical protein ECG_07199 [Echinococcus granulosus]CDS21853.1 hypothetical protein EgrG_002021800 [Echinococcus granulosus]
MSAHSHGSSGLDRNISSRLRQLGLNHRLFRLSRVHVRDFSSDLRFDLRLDLRVVTGPLKMILAATSPRIFSTSTAYCLVKQSIADYQPMLAGPVDPHPDWWHMTWNSPQTIFLHKFPCIIYVCDEDACSGGKRVEAKDNGKEKLYAYLTYRVKWT